MNDTEQQKIESMKRRIVIEVAKEALAIADAMADNDPVDPDTVADNAAIMLRKLAKELQNEDAYAAVYDAAYGMAGARNLAIEMIIKTIGRN